ncbi:MAG: hypothetical protein BMS9Abin11_1258 [Gammaproteobacteria bacterium]|nr:MAG: hypothetical protein BMS9Abin11_1258 [Gammaproteobacteria bacterium]
MDKRKFLVNSLLGVLLLFSGWFAPAEANRVYTLAIVPQYPEIVTHRGWRPFPDYLTKKQTAVPCFGQRSFQGR